MVIIAVFKIIETPEIYTHSHLTAKISKHSKYATTTAIIHLHSTHYASRATFGYSLGKYAQL